MHNRLDYVEVIARLLIDVSTSVSGLNTHELKKDLLKIRLRARHEGSAFFTKTLPTLGKAINIALLGERPLDANRCRKAPNSELPKLFGELFKRVFSSDGMVLTEPCIRCIRILRDLTFVFYKYELPSTETQSNEVITAFECTERDLVDLNLHIMQAADGCISSSSVGVLSTSTGTLENLTNSDTELARLELIRAMRREGHKLFGSLDLSDIYPKHGPGVVSTSEVNEEKYEFSRYNSVIDGVYPYTTYFVPSVLWVESPTDLDRLNLDRPMARVLLVPKDSRGPRLISCEPLENQWIQQGIKELLVKWIENHPVMGGHVNFTDQECNRHLAREGSINGDYATLDLKEASDRVSHTLVQVIFPHHMVRSITVCRTNSTQLPDGRTIDLAKFAPMGSALCFPILASVVWLALTAGDGACSRKTTYVYGDDIIVQRTDVQNAIKRLELIGLKVNVDKSCFTGFFRESCGLDAYRGIEVTPLRLRSVWDHHPQANLYVSYVAKANEAHVRGYHELANYFARLLVRVYGAVPYAITEPTEYEALSGVPYLVFVPNTSNDHAARVPPIGEFLFGNKSWYCRQLRKKWSKRYQKYLFLLRSSEAVTRISTKDKANYFRSLSTKRSSLSNGRVTGGRDPRRRIDTQFAVPMRSAVYTHNRASMLVRKWR